LGKLTLVWRKFRGVTVTRKGHGALVDHTNLGFPASDELAFRGAFRAFSSALLQQLCRPSIVAPVVGFVYTIYLIGWSRLNVTYIAWLQVAGDNTQAYLGWAFLRLDPIWHFPPTFTDWLGWPLGISVAFTDSIPLAAVIARLMSPILPADFQYLGLWTLVNFVLCAYFAFRLCMIVTVKFNLAAFFGGLLLLIAPILVKKVISHNALSSHFLILLSLWLYFKPYPDNCWRCTIFPQIGTVSLAASIHPYLLLMISIISTAFFSRRLLERRCTWWATTLSLVAVSAGALTILVLFGYFLGFDFASYSDEGYRHYSLNLLSPFNSMGWSRFIPELPTATTGQYEGFNYLGLGIFFLLALNVRSVLGGVPKLLNTALAPITLGALLMTLLSVSTLITIGPYILADLSLPDRIVQLLSLFRSSGRLFWPVTYLIMAGAIYLTWLSYKPRSATTFLAIALLLQFVDEAPLREYKQIGVPPRQSPLTAEAWKELGAKTVKLVVLPPTQCRSDNPGGSVGFAIFGMLAVAQHLKTNDVYLAHGVGPKATDLYCKAMLDKFLQNDLEPDAAYVVSDRLLINLGSNGPSSHNCERVDGFNLCRPR
jgi:hypothetical protein